MAFLILKNKYDTNPSFYKRIADKDIAVYKFGFVKKGLFLSYHYKECLYLAQIAPVKIELKLEHKYINEKEYYYIGKGYHSYSEECGTFCNKKSEMIYALFKDKEYCTPYIICSEVGKFIIPKGTEYIENDNGEIVSSCIKWTGEYHLISNIKCDNKAQFKDLKYVLDNK